VTVPFRKQISVRLAFAFVGAALLLSTALAVIQVALNYREDAAEIDRKAAHHLLGARDAALDAVRRRDQAAADAVVERILSLEDIVAAGMLDGEGNALSEREGVNPPAEEGWLSFLTGDGVEEYSIELPLKDGAAGLGKLWVRMNWTEAMSSIVDRAFLFLVSVVTMIGALALFVFVFFRSQVGKPLADLVEAFHNFDPSKPGKSKLPMIVGAREDELMLLRASANEFLESSREYMADRQWAEEDLRERERRLQSVAENIPGIVFQLVRQPDGRFAYSYLSSGIRQLHGLNPEEVVQQRQDLLELIHPDDREQYVAALNDSAKRLRSINMETRHVSPDGDIIWVHTMSRPQRLDSGAVVWDGVSLDVTERKQAEHRIHYLAQYDTLTGLLNREWFLEHLRRAVEVSKRNSQMMAVLFLDLDDFKSVNDTLGHGIGDLLLKAVADRLQGRMRKSDTVTRYGSATVSRLGGDEFTIILNSLKKIDGAGTAAQRIIEALAEPFTIEGNVIHTGTSIGIAIFPDDGDSAEQLLKNADLAMYRSKADKVSRYHFYVPEMHDEVLTRKAMEGDLREALGKGELWLSYQPQVDVRTARIVGMEALLRWTHPERGHVLPSKVIPTAENTNLIIPIGEWVLSEACRQNKAWQDAGLPFAAVTVNVSAVQMEYQDVLAMVEKALSETELHPDYLHIEVTESVVIRHQKAALDTLRALRDIGVKIFLDDFGTGYSSLSYLRRFPIDTLKMDQAFVREVTVNPDDAAIARAIISMAHALSMTVTAEGVETKEQFEFLRAEGCDAVQGHLFSKPIPADELAEVLREGAIHIDRIVEKTG
jgi:diguanylate cyclase (GGDEF)-like protein/PAS domain S-box-containing protein